MRYGDEDRQSSNVEDRRDEGGMGGGRRIRIPIGGGGGMSLTTLLIIGAVMLFMGINPLDVLLGNQGGGGGRVEMPQLPRSETQDRSGRTQVDIPGLPSGRDQTANAPTNEDQMKVFISRVLADTEERLDACFQDLRSDVPRAAAGSVLRIHANGLWRRPGGHGPVLLPD